MPLSECPDSVNRYDKMFGAALIPRCNHAFPDYVKKLPTLYLDGSGSLSCGVYNPRSFRNAFCPNVFSRIALYSSTNPTSGYRNVKSARPARARANILGSRLVLKHFVGRGWSTADSSLDSPLVLFPHSVRPASEARTYWDHIFHDDICIVDCAS